MGKKIIIIAWRWMSLSTDEIDEFPVENNKSQTYERHLVRVKEPSKNARNGSGIDKIKEYINDNNYNYNDEALVFLHRQKREGGSGYQQQARYDLLESEVLCKIKCFMFSDNCLLYQNLLLDRDFRTKRTVIRSGKPLLEEITKVNKETQKPEIDKETFNTVWRYYTLQYIEHTDHIRALFKNCLNHWVEIPNKNDRQNHAYLIQHWRDELSKNEKLYGEFERFLKFSSKPDVVTKTHTLEDQIYQRSIAYIASDEKAKKAYEELKRIVLSSENSKQTFSIKEIWQRMDAIRQRLEI
jgi:hypothetical protein